MQSIFIENNKSYSHASEVKILKENNGIFSLHHQGMIGLILLVLFNTISTFSNKKKKLFKT